MKETTNEAQRTLPPEDRAPVRFPKVAVPIELLDMLGPLRGVSLIASMIEEEYGEPTAKAWFAEVQRIVREGTAGHGEPGHDCEREAREVCQKLADLVLSSVYVLPVDVLLGEATLTAS